ncbi:MAG: serine/threonine protein kinase, partial [Anaerolineae bacterium]|nr:serine/threonine protein kinase [Anaerolineae bacterium]
MSAHIIGGRWEIAGVIGEGGMGDVYRGTDLDTGHAVAIKLLKPDIVDAMPELIDRFKREIALLHQLDHPNIVQILGAVDENDLHYLIMEYVPGGSLKDLIAARGRLGVERALEIALDLTDALTRAHRLRVVYRDLKPANVLMAGDGTPRLTDFGIARVGDSTTMTRTGVLIGTLGYLSPEACRGQPLDARSDIWSFGVLVVEMLIGTNPFRRELVAATLTAILNDPVPDLELERPDAPVALIDLIYRLLEKDPDYRISSMRVVGAELEALLLDGEPPLDETAPGAVTVSVRRRRRPTGPLSGALTVITPGGLQGPVRAIMRHDLAAQPTPFVGRAADLD